MSLPKGVEVHEGGHIRPAWMRTRSKSGSSGVPCPIASAAAPCCHPGEWLAPAPAADWLSSRRIITPKNAGVRRMNALAMALEYDRRPTDSWRPESVDAMEPGEDTAACTVQARRTPPARAASHLADREHRDRPNERRTNVIERPRR